MISGAGQVTLKLTMINPSEWLRTRKNLLDQVKSQVRARIGDGPPALRRYAKNLDREWRGTWRESSVADLSLALQRARVVLSGDFHAYAQSQRSHLRILRDLISDRPVVLALECFSIHDGPAIQAYLAGRMTESRFLEKIKWHKNWGFPWEHYRPLMELARDRGFQVSGLSSPRLTNLKQRDRQMAKWIERLSVARPEALIYVVVGEWHLAATHLPGPLARRFGEDELVVMFQDIEPLYFRMARSKKSAATDVFRRANNRFCVMVSPPWMKWQSYLMYLEHAYDRDLDEDLAIDYSDHVASLVEVLSRDIRVRVHNSSLQVFCPSSRASLTRLKLSVPKKWLKILKYHLEHDFSFLWPDKDWLYLSRPTINHASTLAGQFIHAQMAKRTRVLWSFPDDFLGLIWIEAVGFFFSKWINPKRKAEDWDSLRLRLSAAQPRDKGRQALLLALDHRLSEIVFIETGRLRRKAYRPRESGAYVEAARLAGELLGERLFQKVRSRDIDWTELHSYLKVNVDQSEFKNFYWKLVAKL